MEAVFGAVPVGAENERDMLKFIFTLRRTLELPRFPAIWGFSRDGTEYVYAPTGVVYTADTAPPDTFTLADVRHGPLYTTTLLSALPFLASIPLDRCAAFVCDEKGMRFLLYLPFIDSASQLPFRRMPGYEAFETMADVVAFCEGAYPPALVDPDEWVPMLPTLELQRKAGAPMHWHDEYLAEAFALEEGHSQVPTYAGPRTPDTSDEIRVLPSPPDTVHLAPPWGAEDKDVCARVCTEDESASVQLRSAADAWVITPAAHRDLAARPNAVLTVETQALVRDSDYWVHGGIRLRFYQDWHPHVVATRRMVLQSEAREVQFVIRSGVKYPIWEK